MVISSLLLACLIVKFNVLHAVLLFLIIGAVPGTSYSVSATGMSLGFIVLFWTIAIITIDHVRTKIHASSTKNTEYKPHQLPRRRYAR